MAIIMPINENSDASEELSNIDSSSVFVIPIDEDKLFEPLSEMIDRTSKPFDEIARSLQANIEGVISTVSMPYTLAFASSIQRHWQRIHTAERINSLALDARAEANRLSSPVPKPKTEETEEAREIRHEREAVERASAKMDKLVRSVEGKDAFRHDAIRFLEVLRSDKTLIEAANELIFQSLVLCWGVFEVLARDCFVAHLNANPRSSITLLADPVAKRRFELSKVSLETLATHNFDLSGRMGTLLAEQQDLSDIYSVKSIYQAIFPNQVNLFDALNDPDLRLLSLRRNLIIHQRGIIDMRYKDLTNCSQGIGERLKLSPNDLIAHLGTTIKAAITILNVVSSAH